MTPYIALSTISPGQSLRFWPQQPNTYRTISSREYLGVGAEGVGGGHGLYGDPRLQRVLGLDGAHPARIRPGRPAALLTFPANHQKTDTLAFRLRPAENPNCGSGSSPGSE